MENELDIEGIFKRHGSTVYKVCYTFFGNVSDAEDATQQVFCKLIDKPVAFADEEHEKAWLIVCARNLCKDILKSAARTRRADMPDDMPDETQRAEVSDVLAAVLALPETYRECIYLYYYEGYSTAEIANIAAVAPSTIRNRLADARALLRTALGDDDRG